MCVVYVQFIPVPINGGFVRIKTNTGIRKEKHRKNKFPNILQVFFLVISDFAEKKIWKNYSANNFSQN